MIIITLYQILFISIYYSQVIKFYRVSGFLYHEQTQQILLHQPDLSQGAVSDWLMLSGEDDKKEPVVFFQKLLNKLLSETFDLKNIYPVYNYFHTTFRQTHHIYYAPVARLKNYSSRLGGTLAWFTLKQISKLPISPQTKHDIIVAQRVIQAQAREDEPKPTLPL